MIEFESLRIVSLLHSSEEAANVTHFQYKFPCFWYTIPRFQYKIHHFYSLMDRVDPPHDLLPLPFDATVILLVLLQDLSDLERVAQRTSIQQPWLRILQDLLPPRPKLRQIILDLQSSSFLNTKFLVFVWFWYTISRFEYEIHRNSFSHFWRPRVVLPHGRINRLKLTLVDQGTDIDLSHSIHHI